MSASRPVPVLAYHQVSPRVENNFQKYSLTPTQFHRQMAWLAAAGYRTVGLDQLMDGVQGRSKLPQHPIVITFDDVFADAAKHAPDALARFGFTATFFVVAGLAGRHSGWTQARRGFTAPLAGWDTLRALERAGHTCGSHSLTHPRLATLTPRECERELLESRHLLEDRLGHQVAHLAYPYGSHSAAVIAAARSAEYRTASTIVPGLVSGMSHRWALPRATIKGDRSFVDFISMVRSGKALAEHPTTGTRIIAACRAAAMAWLPLAADVLPPLL
jgi:peptidoglycan/xylan/chitin deacetylase (PgdA/CDA1 family)